MNEGKKFENDFKETECRDITQGSTIIYTLCALSSKCTVKKGPSHY